MSVQTFSNKFITFGLSVGLGALALVQNSAESATLDPSLKKKLSTLVSEPENHSRRRLGPKSYIKEEGRNLKKAKLLWVNFDYLDEIGISIPRDTDWNEIEKLLKPFFAWGTPKPDDPSGTFGELTKEFFADLYGGTGLGLNWGSGRAAESGATQIKGFGPTDAVGMNQGESHSNGAVSCEEGMREAVFGEVNQYAPHGSNRVIALFSRGTKSKGPNGKFTDDVLVIRETSIRPAHFMPNLDGEEEMYRALDPARVQESLEHLFYNLPTPRTAPSNSSLSAQVEAGFREYVDRIAEQHAYLYAHRLYHGATSESNIELSGRLIDYGTETAQAGYGKIKVLTYQDPAGATEEFKNIWVRNFFKSIRKTAPPEMKKLIPSVPSMLEEFDRAYASRLQHEFLSLTGVPDEIVSKLEKKSKSFAKLLIEVATHGATEVIAKYSVPDRLQDYDLENILTSLAKKIQNPDQWPSILEREIPGKSDATRFLRKNFLKDYSQWVNNVSSEVEARGQNLEAFFKKMKKACNAQNEKREDLFRWKMMDENKATINEFHQTGDAQIIRNRIDDRIKKTKKLVEEANHGKMPPVVRPGLLPNCPELLSRAVH